MTRRRRNLCVLAALAVAAGTVIAPFLLPRTEDSTGALRGRIVAWARQLYNALLGRAPIPLKLPPRVYVCTPRAHPPGVRLRPARRSGPRPPFLGPIGVTNVALRKPVTGSGRDPIIGTVRNVTDGVKSPTEDATVELGPGVQWVQIDLLAPHRVYAVVVWHEPGRLNVYRDVVVQVADDPLFLRNVRTLFHNDHDNSAGLGIGKDWEYFETNEGLLVDARGARARLVRLYSNGCTSNDLNRYVEVEVFALPVR